MLEVAQSQFGSGPVAGDGRGEVLVRLRHVGHTFGNGTRALDDVSLDIRRGEFLSLVGPSGCGKSTIMRMIAGLTRPSEGEIRMVGAEGDRQDVSIVFQDATLLPWRTVLANVALPLELRHVSRREREAAARAAIELVGLGPQVKALPRQLSGGMRMRVSIARALVSHPPLLLMDEPFGALDEITRQQLQNELLRIWSQERCTIVFVTHSVMEAVFLSTRIAVMTPSPGRVADVFDVPIAYPRSDDLRTTPEFSAQVAAVSRSLHRNMAGGTPC
ncbi:MAG TPA: ABC transporter ATP-binding protein [Candidatus Dormibacteraeota bacterium]|nr:ABC transporter ATP-binding protein [Candidatus Dormibacteraeota bacterium]